MCKIPPSLHWKILDFVLMEKKNAKGERSVERKRKEINSNVTVNKNI